VYQELFVSGNFSLAPENEDTIKTLVILKELSHSILSYFGHIENYLSMVGNLKITV